MIDKEALEKEKVAWELMIKQLEKDLPKARAYLEMVEKELELLNGK